MALDPNYALAHLWYGDYLIAAERVDEALDEKKRALELDPASTNVILSCGVGLWHARHFDDCHRALPEGGQSPTGLIRGTL